MAGIFSPPESLKRKARGILSGMHPLDKAALGLAPFPVAGDIAGLAADARMYAQEPQSRKPINYGLSALGALPFMPNVSGILRRASNLSDLNKVGNIKLSKQLTPSEKIFFDSVSKNDADLDEFLEMVPSARLNGNKLEIDGKDIESLGKYIDDVVISASTGDKIPPRFRDFSFIKSFYK